MADDLLTARRFKALTGEWTPEELGRFFWLTPDDPQQVFAAITHQITTTQAQALEDLVQREQGKRGSTLAWLKEPAVKTAPPAIKVLITKLETVRHVAR